MRDRRGDGRGGLSAAALSAVAKLTSPGWITPSRRRVLRALLLGVGISVAVTAASRVGALTGWETRMVDSFLFFRDRLPSPDIVLVVIDEDAFQSLQERQPLPRRYLATLGDFLLKSGARVVGIDVQVSRATTPSEDRALVDLVRRWPGRVILASAARAHPDRPGYALVPPFAPELQAALGFANAPLDSDGVIRRMAPVLPDGAGGALPSFALAVLGAASGHSAADLRAAISPSTRRPLDLLLRDPDGRVTHGAPIAPALLFRYRWRVDYVGPAGSFTSVPSGPLVQLAGRGITPDTDNPFQGKIVLVGATFAESRDVYPTPVGSMPGIEIHANDVHTLLSRRALLPPPLAMSLGVLIAACVGVSLLSLWLRPGYVTAVVLGAVALFTVAGYEAYTRGYWLDFAGPIAGMSVYLQASRYLARRRLRQAFGEYVSPEVMERVARDGARLEGETRVVSVLMSDLRGFTTLSERTPAARVSEVMNEYFTAMIDVILSRRGMVQDFIGDAILAVFNAPLDDREHAWHAVDTAVQMQAALARLNARWEAGGRPPLAMGVAVHTGEAFAGNVGSLKKKKYAVIGDTVNTVSRMEGQNRELGTGILISGATRAAVGDRVQSRARGAVMVKGKAQAVELFEVTGPSGAPEASS
jgi:adenylate cyclase